MLPPGSKHGVLIRKLPANAGLVLNPLGTLVVRQTVLPLNTLRDIDSFGGAPLSGPRRFDITLVTLNGTRQTEVPVKDLFAPAQFFALSDEEQLASPPFESLDSGIAFGSDRIVFDESPSLRVNSPLQYEFILIDEDGAEEETTTYDVPPKRLFQHARFAAVAKAAIRNTGIERFSQRLAVPAVKLSQTLGRRVDRRPRRGCAGVQRRALVE